MSKTTARQNFGRGGKRPAAGDYDVGYGKPPKAHQFKPGRSGNPKGRPKGAKSEATIWRELMQERIEVTQPGRRSRRISSLQALLLRCRNAALAGDLKAMKFVLDRLRLFEGSEPEGQTPLDHDDRKVLDSLIERLENEIQMKRE
jgi:hypothetical protein